MPYDKSDDTGPGRQSRRHSGAYDAEFDLGYDGDSDVLTDPGSGRLPSGGRSSEARAAAPVWERDAGEELWSEYADVDVDDASDQSDDEPGDEPHSDWSFSERSFLDDTPHRDDASHRDGAARSDDASFLGDNSSRGDVLSRDDVSHQDEKSYQEEEAPYIDTSFLDDISYRSYRDDSYRNGKSYREAKPYRDEKSYVDDTVHGGDGPSRVDKPYEEKAYRTDRSYRDYQERSYNDGSYRNGSSRNGSSRNGSSRNGSRSYRGDPAYDGGGYRPEVDYDPDYQPDYGRPDFEYDEDFEPDHATEFRRVGASPPPSRAAATRAARRPKPLKPAGRRRIGRWVLVVCLTLVALVGVVAAVVWRYADGLLSGQQTQVAGTAVAEAGEPINIVLVGSDSREGAAGESLGQNTEEVGGERADTIMVLHVNPEQQRAVLVSIPRDLQTQVNGETAKINASGTGGPSLIVDTVEQTTGLDINHFVQVDFAGFIEVVDTLGGVELCNDTGEPLVDRMAGLNMPPGCHNFDGERALGFVRARYIDDDFGRIDRQQQFLRALMGKIGSAGNLINVPQLVTLGNQLSDTMVTDQGFSASEAVRIARGMGSLSLNDVDMRTFPSIGAGPECQGCAAFVRPLPEAQLLMQAIAEGDETLPPVGITGKGEDLVTLADTPVRVVNGGEVAGAAADTATRLEELGMVTSVEGNTPEPIGPASQISYGENMAAQAELLQAMLPGVDLQLVAADPEDGPGPNSLTLIIGSSWPGADVATGRSGVSGLTPDPVVPDSDNSSVPEPEFGGGGGDAADAEAPNQAEPATEPEDLGY